MQAVITAGLLLLCEMETKFSLESLHGLEADITEWYRLHGMRGYMVTESNLMRYNKDTLARALTGIINLLGRGQELLNDAALDLDNLKRDHILNQSKLLAVQDELINKNSEHLEQVKSTVDEKLTSWADVVEKNSKQCQQPSSLSEKKLRQVVKSAIQDSDRSGNVMIFNMEEGNETTTCADSDKVAVQEILSLTGVVTECEVNCERVGRPEKDKSRPLKVAIGNATVVSVILKKSKVLRDNDKCNRVFISPDRSKEERIERKKLVEELKQKQ